MAEKSKKPLVSEDWNLFFMAGNAIENQNNLLSSLLEEIGSSYLTQFQKRPVKNLKNYLKKIVKICENVRQGNSSFDKIFHSKRANISAR